LAAVIASVQVGQNRSREYVDRSQQVVSRDHLVEAKLKKELPLISVLPPSKQESLFARLLRPLF
jgi:hypothetical protein